MEVAEFVDKFAESFQRFMEEAQLSSALTMVIDEGVLSEVNIKFSVIQTSMFKLLQELQSLHNLCDSSGAERKGSETPCASCKEREEDEDKKSLLTLDANVIQITANCKEIDRRIQAFIDRKQLEKDDTNRREFCSMAPHSVEMSCARTDTVFVSKPEGKSHVKVSKVINKYGPQTRPALVSMPHVRAAVKRERIEEDTHGQDVPSGVGSGVEERLRNMESFLKVKPGQNNPDVFQRLKHLEDRILYLESISPEYSHISSSVSRSQRGNMGGKAPGQDSAVRDIDNRIKELQHALRAKKAKMEDAGAGKTEI